MRTKTEKRKLPIAAEQAIAGLQDGLVFELAQYIASIQETIARMQSAKSKVQRKWNLGMINYWLDVLQDCQQAMDRFNNSCNRSK